MGKVRNMSLELSAHVLLEHELDFVHEPYDAADLVRATTAEDDEAALANTIAAKTKCECWPFVWGQLLGREYWLKYCTGESIRSDASLMLVGDWRKSIKLTSMAFERDLAGQGGT